MMPTPVVIPIFAGQGTTRSSLAQAANQAVRDADAPAGSLLLSSCLDAFLSELAALTPDELDQSGISPSDFDEPRRLLIPDPKYARNHVISGIALFLAQTLRYQSYVQSTSRSFPDLLKTNVDHAIGVLGLSSGIFPASVVAASRSPLSYITVAVQVFRLVFWLSLRVVQFTRQCLKEKPVDSTLPWSVACLGLPKADVEQHIARFEQKYCRVPSLRVTAVVDERNVTVSGRPDVLVRFSTFVSRHCTVHPTTVDALYHSDLHRPHTRDRILADVLARDIRFPDFQDLLCPLRSTTSGDVVQPSPDHPSLVGLVLDMVLVYPVNWDLVAKKVASVVPADVGLLAINVGPGSSTLRALERAVPECVLRCVDATLDTRGEAVSTLAKQEPIAVIGMAAHTPGAANAAQLWDVLERGTNTVSKIPDDRFGLPVHGVGSPCEVKVDTGNFMTDFADFDHKFFKISPREARCMDPQQRVLLHTAYEALESAGYVPDATPCFQRATFGCYIGAATHDYAENLGDNIDIHYSTGTLGAFLSGRISYAMQFGGPSVVVDTACSSSIVAIHQACRALMVKDCNAALAGGVNIMTSPNMFVGLERGHFLSPSGQCKSFDASADGYSRGEGCCMFVLKRLSDAVAENDNILGVIRGVEVNQSGLASSITHPHGPTQVDLLKALVENSGICPTRVSVVEAHGAGTEAGDACELASIRSVLSQGRSRNNPLHVTSIKANIGHLEAASGAVGLVKLLLMLRRNVIPAQISLKTLHPLIAPLDVDHTVIDTLPVPWLAGAMPRVAVLNNFGAAGSNGTLILEEYVKPDHSPAGTLSFVFSLSAKTAGALDNMRSRCVEWLGDAQNHGVRLGDIAYTATARRQLYPFRLTVTVRDKDQLVRALHMAPVTHVERQGGQVIFIFSGQGSQYLNMGGSLYATSTVFKNCIDRCQRCLLSLGYPGVLPIISPGTSGYVLSEDEAFEAYQCGILAVEFALVALWKHWGVVPAGVVGQSLGEYAAMVTAGVLSIETALSIVAKRARLMSRACAVGKTGMCSVNLASAKVRETLAADASWSNVTVACVNTESSCVVSGPVEDLRALATHLTTTFGCKTVPLQVPLGFHSSAMDPILDDLREHVAMLPVHPPSIPIASNVYGTVVPVGDGLAFQADYFVKHCRQPVLFAQGVRELEQYMDSTQIDAWIDVGPNAICLPMIEATLSSSSRDALRLPSMLKDTSAWDTLTSSLAQLCRTAVPLDWRQVFDERSAFSCVDLPSYPFEAQRFLVPYTERAVRATASELTPERHVPDHPMLSSWSQYPSRQNGNAAIFETPIGCLASYMEGHKVGGYALCPASVYLEQALAGAIIAQRYMALDFGRCMPVLRAVEFSRPLVLRWEIRLIVRTHVTVHEDGTGSFSITSRLESSREEHVHVHGDVRFSSVRETTAGLALEHAGVARRAEALACRDQPPEVFGTHAAYEVVFPRVVEYAKDYHTIESLTVGGDGVSGVARMSLSGPLGIQTVFLDTMLHMAGFMVNLRGDVSDAYICSGVHHLKVLRDRLDSKHSYTVYCTNNWTASRDFVTADIVAVQESDPPTVVAHLEGAQFRKVRLTSLHRGLAIAADPSGIRSRTRTDSNAIVTPSSPRSVIFGRSRSDTLSSALLRGGVVDDVGDGEACYSTSCSGPTSPQTLVSEGGSTFGKRLWGIVEGERVRGIMAEVLGIVDCEEIKDGADFGSLGLDSLGSIEAQQALRVALNRPIPHDVFVRCPTLSALCDFLVEEVGEEDVPDEKSCGELCSGGIAGDIEAGYSTSCSGPTSPQTLVSEGRCAFEKRLLGVVSGERVRGILADVLGIVNCEEIKDGADFGSLGLDSLGSIEAQQVLRVALNRPIPHDVFVRCPTLSALCDFLAEELEEEDAPNGESCCGEEPRTMCSDDVALVALQRCPESRCAPLYLVHDGSGLVSQYERLLPLHRDVWGLGNPRLFRDDPWETLEEMAWAYAHAIERHAGDGAVMLGGWSFGGVLAFEIARILAARDIDVTGVVLIDSPSPSAPVPLPDALIDRLLVDVPSTALVARQFRQSATLLGRYWPGRGNEAREVPIAFLRCMAGYCPEGVRPEDVPAWFRERDDDDGGRGRERIVGPWEALVRHPIPVWDVPGHHFEPFSRVHVKETSVQLDRACRYLESL